MVNKIHLEHIMSLMTVMKTEPGKRRETEEVTNILSKS